MTQTDRKKTVRTIATVVLLTMALLCVMAMPAAAQSELHTSIVTGQTKTVAPEPWPEQQAFVFYWPHEAETRTVTVHHRFFFDPRSDPSGFGNVKFYWKDLAIPNDQWHYWDIKEFGFIYPNAKTTLYSGSNTIAYQFVITHYHSFALPIFVHVY
ncbi:MAG: hypothetical protein U9N04_04605 [Patescibacteria group bacterium]|nr:hypothetical protein [Patescibacteria group bacterium]